MSGTYNDTNRQPLPRCLDYSTACAIGLQRNIIRQDTSIRPQHDFDDILSKWLEKKDIFSAIDLVSESLILKNFTSENTKKAAQFILGNTTEKQFSPRELATHYLETKSTGILGSKEQVTPIDFTHEQVARLKKTVIFNPINALAWADLAICYAALSQVEKSKLSMKIALNLGKSNRFLLRLASRCFLHGGEPDRALSILNKSDLSRSDPWIISAEMAIAEVNGVQSKRMSFAKHIISNENLSDYSRSELASCLGTIELRNGSVRRAKKLVRQALIDPTENALAQIEWMNAGGHLNLSDTIKIANKIPAPYEAKTRHFFITKRFKNSLNSAKMWSKYQPLSSRPLIFASYIASVCLGDDHEAIRILNSALPSQQDEAMYFNNLACSLARVGEVEQAIDKLKKIEHRQLSEYEKPAILATQGLISFRKGQSELARKQYKDAILGFKKLRENRSLAIATYYWAAEEQRIKSEEALKIIEDLRTLVKHYNVIELDKRIKKFKI